MILDILKDKEKIKHYITYGIFGVLTTIVSFGSFSILRIIFETVNQTILNAVSIFIAIVFAYFTNRKYVFKSTEKNMVKEFVLFVACRGISTIFEIVAFFILNELMNIEGLISKAVVSIVVIILNYIMSKVFVFSKKIQKN